jgi:hypothetical protein
MTAEAVVAFFLIAGIVTGQFVSLVVMTLADYFKWSDRPFEATQKLSFGMLLTGLTIFCHIHVGSILTFILMALLVCFAHKFISAYDRMKAAEADK